MPSPAKGLSFGLDWDADAYENLNGGVRPGYATDSVLSASFGLDTGALGWWQGGQFALGLQAIASTHPSEYAGDLQTLSNLDAPNQRHVAEFWYSQSFGNTLVRGGIMDVNDFFVVTDAALFMPNSSFTIAPTLSMDIPAPTYPDSAWGLMAQLGGDNDDWQLGAFQGNPENRASALREGTTLIAERDWRNPAQGAHIGFGAWYRRAPAEAGLPASDWGVYAILEHALPQHPDAVAFLQLGASPGEVNEVPAYLGAGMHFSNVSRAVSDVGIGFARAWIRDRAAETSLETTAQIPLFTGGLVLQPDVQYIFHPSGTHPNALVVGLRLHLTLY